MVSLAWLLWFLQNPGNDFEDVKCCCENKIDLSDFEDIFASSGSLDLQIMWKPVYEPDLSRSVPSLLDSHLQDLQERSTSFGSRSRFGGSGSLVGSKAGSRSTKFDDLSSSWQNLQRQLGTKERELHVALQKQERYQSTVQDVTARMERVQQKLVPLGTSPFRNLDGQIAEQKEAEQEIECIREDIARVKERGRQIMESSDPEGYQAMQATLSMLTDKINSLQAMADDKAKILQNAIKGKERHTVALGAYKKHVKAIEDWLGEMKVRQAATPLVTDSVGALQVQLQENKDLQNELNRRLQHVADLALQCDNLCELETPESADKLRTQLATQQQNLGNLKLAAIEKQAPLRAAIKESEKRTREMDDYEQNLKNLQRWITDTKNLSHGPFVSEEAALVSMTPHQKQELQQQLQSDLSQHRTLVRQLSTEMRSRDHPRPRETTIITQGFPPLREEDLQPRWESLSRELQQKKEHLEDLVQKSNDLIGPAKYGRRSYDPDHTPQLKDVRRHLAALNDLWKQLQVQVDDKQLRLDKALEFQQSYQDALANVSRWLDLTEQKLFAPDSTMNSEEKVQENEDIQREIRSLQGEIQSMSRAAQELLSVTNADSHELIRQSLANLNNRVKSLESQAREQGDKLRTVDRNYKSYKEEVQQLEGKLLETRDIMSSPTHSTPVRQQVDKMQKIESQMKKCEAQLEGVKKLGTELSAMDPEIISPYEMESLQSNFMDIQRKVMEKKASLQESVSVQEQYEKLLADYADFLETADDKLRTEQISVRDLEHLKEQLVAHKDFFSDLEVHRAMLDSLVAQCDKATKQKHLPQHTRLSNLTYVLQDKASLHGQRLDRLVRQWGELDEKFGQLQRFLSDLETQIPKPIANQDTLQTIQNKITTFQRLQRELTDEKPVVFQVVDKGKQLLHSVNCPGLEMLVTEIAEKWVDLNTELSHELKRSQSLGDQLQVFEAEAAILKSWLTAARSKLNSIKQLSSSDMKSIATVRGKIDKILEFRKDVEDQLPLKEKVLSIGNQLLQNKVYQTADLQDRTRHLEHEWAHLEHDINNSEEYLHQAQMDLMPSRQALGELNAWLTEIEETLADEKSKPLKNLGDMEVLLKKYKSYKIDLSSKQLTVDFVNQEVLQPKDDLDGPPPAERNEFSERLGVLNGRWLEVSKHVSDRLKSLEAVHNKWEEFERSITRLVEWFHEQEDKLKKYRLIGHEVSVRQTLKDVKALQTTLRLKEGDVNHVRELGDTLIQLSEESPQVRQCIHTNMRSLADEKLKLDGNVTQVNKLLEDILSQWDGYHGEMQAVTQTLAETEYCLQRYALIGGDLATLKIQVEKLENLIKEMDRQSPRFDRYTKLATRLSEVCEPTTRQEVKKTQSDLQQRWQSVYGDLQTRTGKFRDCLEQWNIYEEEFSSARTWLDSKEKLCDELLYGKEERVRRDANLRNCQTLQRDLDQFQSQLANLYRVGEDVTKHMDPSSIVNITSKLSSLEQRLLTLRQKLAKHVQSLQGDLSQQRRFQEAFENVQAFVSQAQRILGMEDPNRSADMQALSNRLDHLKELCTQFNDNSTQLDALNDLGYRLALNETSAADLQDLNHKWQALYAETKERCKALQGLLLVQQDFTSKCDTWMTFLAQTEADLSTEIAGNLIDLLAQQKKCEKFEAESYSRQQILHAIISDGQTMMNDGDIENKEQFQQKLILLANQWQSVVRRANQRKAIIDTTIKQWQGFNEQAEKLRAWLKEKEEGLEVFTFDKASLQKIKNLVEKAKNTQNEFKLQEDMFKNMNSQGKQLLQRADDKAQEELRVSMAQVQQHWHQIFVKLDSEREKLEGVLKHWRECEDDIEEILTWLKDTRKSLLGNLPNAYEELQADMHKCKDIEVAFANAEPKRQSLLANEKTLSRTIEPEDLNVLHQRIRLLNKQWDELCNQASLRAQRIDDTMFRWSSFSQKFKELCDWIDKMEVKVISSKDYHIEDLLNRMEKDFKNELSDKEKSKNDLVSQGQGLMKVSNEVRSSDIEQKIQRLEDKWEHLKAVIAFRQRKLQETLLAVQQLDVSMNHLRKWLASMEDELSAPVVYAECERKEIQRRLQHQSELQHDIERHSPGVGSVLNLCEVLLHDSDACPTDVEFNGLQTAMKNLERRWRTICQMAPEMRSRIEETWRLWQTLIDDCQAFSDWLKVIESEVREVAVDQLNVSTSSEEFSHCETVQRKIHENLGKLENINRQYRRLAREGRTDTNGTLKSIMQDANDRWDKLQGKMSANLRDLRHSSSIREDFKRTKDALLSWLTEIDMQITNIEHLSSMNANGKMIEMRRIQDEIDSRARKFNFLDEAALYLIQKGDSAESITTQAEIDSFRQYHRQVLDRVAIANARYSAREVEDRLHLNEDELDQLERELYDLDPDKPLTLNWDMKEIEAYLESSPPESPPEKRRAMLKKLRERSRSRSQSPQKLPSNTAIRASPLLGSPSRFIRKSEAPMTSTPRLRPESPSRSRSPTRSLRSKSPRLVAKDFVDAAREPSPSRQERFNQMKRELTQRGSKEDQIENILEKLADALEDATEKLNMADHALHRDIPSRPGPQRKSAAYIRSLDEAEKSVEDVRRIHRLLKAETGLSSIASADSQVTAIVSRWEMLQAGAIQKDYRLSQCRQDWAQFHADLDNMTAWLDEAEGLQHSQKRLPGEITELDSIIRQHKEFFKQDFLLQLEAKKTRVLSINLTSREIIDLATEEGRQLHDRLKRMNGRWEAVCAQATRLQSELQDALMRCQEFHHTIHDLLLWEESIETRIQQCEPINLGNDEAALWNRLRKLKDIKFDLEKNQPRVMSLRDTADQLLMNSESPEMCQAKDKMHIIANRLKALLRLCSSYISSLETRLESKSVVRSPDRSFELSGSPASSSASSPRDSAIRTSTPTQPYRPKFRPHQPSSLTAKPRARSPFALSRQRVFGIRPYLSGLIRALQGGAVQSTADISTRPLDPNEEIEAGCCHRLFLRVLRCALPLQLLLLLLLATTCLVPITEEDYSCTLANNLRRSLDTMLQYTDGPPPS
ncbi:hypothetical protein DPMN_088560 [Dreissena polymorpha]|uniref:KASH domain-containing protein n=1 Tax=Dreissena polymorpha TaxID=45954 RepID=A0A9D4KUR5_DREPO|nr:hypothetical protein DPMN_088560 [Dreissena polymorpha]